VIKLEAPGPSWWEENDLLWETAHRSTDIFLLYCTFSGEEVTQGSTGFFAGDTNHDPTGQSIEPIRGCAV